MKKFLTIFITPIAMLFLTIIKLPSVEPYLYEKQSIERIEDNFQQKLEPVNNEAPIKTPKGIILFGFAISYILMLQTFIILATILTYYVTMYSPYNRYEELAKKRWIMMDYLSDIMLAKYGQYNINCNIMIPKRKFLYFIEPKNSNSNKRKLTLTGKVFEVVWSRGEGVNKRLRITTNQGVSGVVYKEGKRIISKDFTVAQNVHLNFTGSQIEICKDIKMLSSCPIIVENPKVYRRKTYVLGVLNIEGTNDDSVNLIKDPEISKNFNKDVYGLAKICATLLT